MHAKLELNEIETYFLVRTIKLNLKGARSTFSSFYDFALIQHTNFSLCSNGELIEPVDFSIGHSFMIA